MNTVFICYHSVTVNVQEIRTCYSSPSIMKTQARVQLSHIIDASCVASLAPDGHCWDPSPNPPPAFYACTICSRDRSVSLYPAPLSAILVNTHPVSTFTAVHGQSNQIEAALTLAGGLLGSFRTLLSCILNYCTPPLPTTTHLPKSAQKE